MPVKPVPALLLFAASLITGFGLLLAQGLEDDSAHIDHFGSSLTRSLASQAIEPFLAEDLIHLGVLANRLMELPEVLGVAVHTVDDRTLTLSGDVLRGRPFSEPIVHDETIVGYVRLHIDDHAFGQAPSAGPIVLAVLWMCLVPASLLAARLVTSSAFAGQRRTGQDDPGLILVGEAENPPEGDESCYLVVVNLFNQLTLSPDQRNGELAFARATADSVAAQYNGYLEDLPGTGLLLRFRSDASDDRPFHVLCAAFVLAQLLRAAETWGNYRLGVHLIEQASASAADDEVVADGVVLSALAKDATMVIGAACFDRIPYPQRFESEPMAHPLLDELLTIGRGAYLVQELAPPHDEVVAQRMEELLYPDRSTASESTF